MNEAPGIRFGVVATFLLLLELAFSRDVVVYGRQDAHERR
jgi:hypothetical protein